MRITEFLQVATDAVRLAANVVGPFWFSHSSGYAQELGRPGLALLNREWAAVAADTRT